MEIFNYDDYRSYLKSALIEKNSKQRGNLSKLAQALKIHSSLLSMILNGKRSLTLEQAFDLAQYFELNPLETDYLATLAQIERAGTHQLKTYFMKKIADLKNQASELKSRVKLTQSLSSLDQSIFYSSWHYSAIHLFCSTSSIGKTMVEIKNEFKISNERVLEVIEFLTSKSFLVEIQHRFQTGIQSSMIEYGSPYLGSHHHNWRSRSLARIDDLSKKEIMITAPFSISEKDFAKIREMVLKTAKAASEIIVESPPEKVACMNLDLFWVVPSEREI